jgi:poly-gamma-glutamate capsule biosynthesis protein CapA/YwtB (metallophosphatase superfamily)
MRRGARLLAVAGVLALAATPVLAQAPAQPKPSNDPTEFLRGPPKPASVKGRFSVASVGDLMLARPASGIADPEFQKVLEMIRAADVAIGNQEGPAFDPKALTRAAYGQGGLSGVPEMPVDYKAMGLDLIAQANNHSTDYGAEAVVQAADLLEAAGVGHAGAGPNLQTARRAGFYATPKGKVGLVSTASTFKVNASANDAWGQLPERGGISVLRTRTIRLVNADQFATVKRLATELASPMRPAPKTDTNQVTFGDQTYRLADKPGLKYDMDLYDEAGLLKAVRDGKAQSDLIVFNIHAHESPTGVDDDTPTPPDFLITLFHEVVDAGGDVVMGGGPHSMRGVEIYKGKPIFYGLGLFFFKPQLGGPPNVPGAMPDDGYPREPDPRPGNPPSWYDSVLAISDFDGGKLKQVRLYPVDLMNAGTQGARGLPHFATGERARQILTRLQTDSAQFGAKIAVQGDMGVIKVR